MPYRDDEENRRLALKSNNEKLVDQVWKLKERIENMKKPSLMKRIGAKKLGWALIVIAANCVAYLMVCAFHADWSSYSVFDETLTLWHPYILTVFAGMNMGASGIALVTKD